MDEFLNGIDNPENIDNAEETENKVEVVPEIPTATVTEQVSEEIPELTEPEIVPSQTFGEPDISESGETQPDTEYEEPEIENTEYNQPQQNEFTPVYNPVTYSPVNPINDYKPMSKGLKIFAGIMAAVILLTGTCFAGYVIGKNSVSIGKTKVDSVDLAAAPEKTDEMTPAQVYEEVNKSIVGIRIYNSSNQGGQASGIIFSEDGYIVTNDHIYSEIPAAKFRIYTHDGKEYDAEYVAGDQISDLAVLKIDASGFTPAVFGNSDELYYGQNVVAIGRPSEATEPSSITRGVISAIDRRVQTTSSYSARLIQTDSAINPGSSGGALVNMYGQVIGVTSSKLASVEYDAVGYAIPTTIMKRIVDELIENGRVESRAKLGVTYTAIDSISAEINQYPTTGLLLASVAEDSDLYGKAQEGDFITQINGIDVTSDDIVLDIIEQSRAGDKITVTIYTSSGKTKTVEAVLKANVSESSYTLAESSGNYSESYGDSGNSENGGGTFDFPFGE